ncbi:MAG: hypothetical protein WKF86_11710, partial [Acidimicrobiales bacterium]
MAKRRKIETDKWISVKLDGDLRAHLHLGRREGRTVVDGLYLWGEEITTATLPRVHPARVLASVRQEDFAPKSRRTETGWALTDEYKKSAAFLLDLIALTGVDDADVTLGDLRSRAKEGTEGRPRVPLGRPGETPEDRDDFYRRVAKAYTSAAVDSGRPAAVLAEENETPIDTVHRWVKEARRRGHLAAGRPRKAG